MSNECDGDCGPWMLWNKRLSVCIGFCSGEQCFVPCDNKDNETGLTLSERDNLSTSTLNIIWGVVRGNG